MTIINSKEGDKNTQENVPLVEFSRRKRCRKRLGVAVGSRWNVTSFEIRNFIENIKRKEKRKETLRRSCLRGAGPRRIARPSGT